MLGLTNDNIPAKRTGVLAPVLLAGGVQLPLVNEFYTVSKIMRLSDRNIV